MLDLKRLAPLAVLLCLTVPLQVGCGDDTGGGQGGTTSSSTSSGTGGDSTSSSAGGATGQGGGGAGGAAGQGGGGAGGPFASCAEAGAPDCFSNYDCADASTRCENVGTADAQVACCVPGARGTGELGATCTGENDCKSSLCIEIDADTSVCTDACDDTAPCSAPLPECSYIFGSNSELDFCLP
jgi:hypothetical protein